MDNFKDGEVLKGGFTITLETAGVTLVVNTCSPSYSTESVELKDENNLPSAQDLTNALRTANLNVQINKAADRGDYRLDTFTTAHIDGTSRKWVISNQGGSLSKGDATAYDFTVNEVINP